VWVSLLKPSVTISICMKKQFSADPNYVHLNHPNNQTLLNMNMCVPVIFKSKDSILQRCRKQCETSLINSEKNIEEVIRMHELTIGGYNELNAEN